MHPTFSQQLKDFKLTYLLIGLNLVAYAFSVLKSGSVADIDLEVLVSLGALFGPITVVHGHWQDLFTAMFLHAGMTHLLMNMFSLYLVGREVERYFDESAYLGIYLFSGVIGSLASLYMHPASVGVGASGAIFGLFGALAGFFLAHREHIATQAKAFMKDFAIILGINLALGFMVESIDVSAHIGGLVVGMLGGVIISKNPKWIWFFAIAMLAIISLFVQYLPTQYAQTLF